jgi:hypothetical protein
MKKDERLYLEDLSKKLYGSKSKYLKMVTKGEKAPMEEILEDGTSRKYIGIHYQTLEQVKDLMEELMKEEDELRAKQEAEALEQKAAREQQKADDDQAGYAEKLIEDIKDASDVLKYSEEKPHDPVMDVLETVGD